MLCNRIVRPAVMSATFFLMPFPLLPLVIISQECNYFVYWPIRSQHKLERIAMSRDFTKVIKISVSFQVRSYKSIGTRKEIKYISFRNLYTYVNVKYVI